MPKHLFVGHGTWISQGVELAREAAGAFGDFTIRYLGLTGCQDSLRVDGSNDARNIILTAEIGDDIAALHEDPEQRIIRVLC